MRPRPRSFTSNRLIAFLTASALSTAALSVWPSGARASSQTAPFAGHVGLTRATSTPAFPAPVQAPQGAPNILLILIDDAGFAVSSAFGGAARTPNIERFAAEGVRYNRFHTTAICSPTRAALLTGRNHHQVGFGNLQDLAAGFPAYDTVWNPQTASIARILQTDGYSTAAFGKWHNTPKWEISPAGPFTHWPTGLGFDHFYGYMAGTDDQWEPHLYNDTTSIPAPGTPDQGYHLTPDLVNRAVAWVDDHDAAAANRPYFLYFATGAVHMPHQVPKAWIERNKGRFDGGWDRYREEAFARQKALGVVPQDAKLTPRPAGLPAWDSLPQDQRRLYARQMEVYSAFMEETDAEIGRLVDTLRKRPGGDNLLIFYIIGDNGGSAEGGIEGTIVNETSKLGGAPEGLQVQLANIDKLGGPDVANNYAAGWAWATTTPFKWVKQVASHFGGTRNPLIVDWPGHTTESGRVRSQFAHVNDIAPTILDVIGKTLPKDISGVEQIPFEGHSLKATFSDPNAPETHTEQYFEIFGNRAIYKDGWVAAAKRNYDPWNLSTALNHVFGDNPDNDRWELYHVAEDFSEANDLAGSDPKRLEALKAEFTREGLRNNVFPLVPLPIGAPTISDPHQRSFTYEPDVSCLPQNVLPNIIGPAHTLRTEIAKPSPTGSGVILAEGGRLGGWVLYEKDHHLVFENNAFGQHRDTISSSGALAATVHELGFSFTPDKPPTAALPLARRAADGTIRLLADGQEIAHGAVHLYPSVMASYSETFDIGQDRGSQVSRDPAARKPFDGSLGQTHITLP